ncbi:MAG TPA: hypothetical protein VHG92_07160 [Afifellaceae bacterium]|nr:hypothetical protein [Afifellaceae bacterium]
MRYLSSIRAVPLGGFALLAVGGLGGCISTATYGTGEAPEATLLREATGGILSDDEKVAIDYEPRAGLVIPPAAQLPEPAPAPSQLAAGAWPVEQAKEPRSPSVVGENDGTDRSAISPEYIRRMKPFGQLTAGRGNQGVRMNEVGAAQSFANDQSRGAQMEQFQTALADADGLTSSAAQRRYLTDPPSHYREPAETAPMEFEDIQRKKKGFFARLFGG